MESDSIYAGVPAKFIKKVDPEQSKEMNQKIASNYLMYAGWFKEEKLNDTREDEKEGAAKP